MRSKHLDVSRVLMAIDPAKQQWLHGVRLAASLAQHGVQTALACLGTPTESQLERASAIDQIEIRYSSDSNAVEWMLFLEMLVEPDIVQLFNPQHVMLPWRSPVVLNVDEAALALPKADLTTTTTLANLVTVHDEATFEKLQALVGLDPFVAVLPFTNGCGGKYCLAYQEILQSVHLDLGADSAGRLELI